MTPTQKTTALAIGVAAFLMLALVAGIKFASVTNAPGPPSAPAGAQGQASAPAITPDVVDRLPDSSNADLAQAHLQAVKVKIAAAQGEMARASVANKGGFVEKSRADIDAALSHASAALDYLAAHADAAARPATPAAVALDANPDPRGRGGTAPNLRTALTNIKAAFDELQKSPGGDLGGSRASLETDLRQSAADLVAGINYAASATANPGARNAAPPNPPARGPVTRGNRPPETPDILQGLDATHDTAMGRLAEAQIHVQAVLTQIDKLSSTFGGTLAKVRDDAKQSLADIDKAMAYTKEHPDANPLPPGPYKGLPVIPSPWPPPQVPDYARYMTEVDRVTIRLQPSADPQTRLELLYAFNSAEKFQRTFMPDTNAANTPQVEDMGGSKVTLLGDSVQLMNDLLAALDYAHAHEPPPAAPAPLPAGMIAPKESLSLEIAPYAKTFTEGVPLELSVSFRNTGASPLRLPNNAGLYGDWLLRLQTPAGKTLTAGIFQTNGTGTLTAHASRPIAPGESLRLVAGFSNRTFNFQEGDLSFADFQKVAQASPLAAPGRGPRGLTVPAPEMEFPEGAYKVTLTARFPNAITTDGDASPVWNFDALTSNTIDVAFARLKPEEAGTISGKALSPDGTPAAGAIVSWQRPVPFNTPPVTGSGYANSIANNTTPPTPPPVRPNTTYAGGTDAATTDANGDFTIGSLAPGTYIITFRATGSIAGGSVQPVEVKSGADTKLPAPVKLAPARNGVGGAGG